MAHPARQWLKRLLSEVVPRVPSPVARRLAGSFCPIFMLHRLSPEGDAHAQSAAHVERCLQYMRKHRYTPMALADLARVLQQGLPLPARGVVFTIDDGFKDQFEYAGPLFARFEAPLTCFVITGFLDGELWPWDDQIPHIFRGARNRRFALELPDGKTEQFDLNTQDPARLASALRDRLKTLPQDTLYPWLSTLYLAADVEEPPGPPPDMQAMSWPDARHFIAMGHAIAPHTRTHRILSQLSDAASHAEIFDSALRVHEETGRHSAVFAYPTGRLQDFGVREMSALGEQGIGCAVSTDPRAVLAGDRIHALPRYSLPNTVADFAQYLGFFEVLKARFRA